MHDHATGAPTAAAYGEAKTYSHLLLHDLGQAGNVAGRMHMAHIDFLALTVIVDHDCDPVMMEPVMTATVPRTRGLGIAIGRLLSEAQKT